MIQTNSKTFWLIQEVSVIVLWGIFIFLWINMGWYWPVVILLILHLSENLVSHKKVAGKGYSTLETFLYTLIYGYTWWIPVQKGIFDFKQAKIK